jgi:hypothetical protein
MADFVRDGCCLVHLIGLYEGDAACRVTVLFDESVFSARIVCLGTGEAPQLNRGSKNRGSACADTKPAFAIIPKRL